MMAIAEFIGDNAEKDDILDATGSVRLQSLVYVRWLAVFGQAFSLALVYWVMGYDLPIIPAILLVSASALLNILVTLSHKSTARLSNFEAILYLFYDALQLTGLLYLTGGLANPFALLYLVPVTISATNLSGRGTLFLCFTTITCITFLAFFREPLPLPDVEIHLSDIYILGIWSSLALGTIFLSGYSWRISSDARRMTKALSIARMALWREQQLSVVGGIAASTAHELGTPLNTILLISEELSKEFPENSPHAEDAKLLYDQALKCADVLSQLSQGPTDNRFLQKDAHHNYLPFHSLISLIVGKYSDRHANFTIETEGDLDLQPKLYATPEIMHGLGNLISNAAEFATENVLISLKWNNKKASVVIQDDGVGFDEEILARLGDPYNSSRAGRGGMGLGVFISEMLINHSGGNIIFSNTKGSGARVMVEWPRKYLEKADPYL